jgi:UDP-2,3-diacylglucosamine pyrophosphatase LpxH
MHPLTAARQSSALNAGSLKMEVQYDALILSDLHLGSDNCEAKELVALLELIRAGQIRTESIILNGDVFDSCDFRRLTKSHWKVLSLIRKMSDELEIIWINGNHDGPVEIFSHLLGVTVRDDLILHSGAKRIFIHHGHRFDQFIDRHPIITGIADFAYRLLQKIDRSHTIARTAKRKSKVFLRCSELIRTRSLELAHRMNCQMVCCGHTHHAVEETEGEIRYFNSGCWTERPCHYLSVENGTIQLHAFRSSNWLSVWQEESPEQEPFLEQAHRVHG